MRYSKSNISIATRTVVSLLPAALALTTPLSSHAQQSQAAGAAAQTNTINKEQSNGTGFPGATNAQGITNTTVQSNPSTATSLPAGTYDAGGGFTFQLNYVSESAGNVSGGISKGADYADQILYAVDIDLGRTLGLAGGTIHLLGTTRDGRSLAVDHIGNSLASQEIYDGSENSRITLASYEQKLFNDRLDVEVGRLPGQGAFLVSPLYCDFQNVATCGSPEIVFNDSNFTFFPPSTWGGHAKFFFTPKVFLHAGAFEVQPSTQTTADGGLNFGLDGATGVVIPVELGYTTTAANDPLPRNYAIGAIIDQSSYNDPVSGPFVNVRGTVAPGNIAGPVRDFGRSIVYGRFDQALFKRRGAFPQELQIFGAVLGGTGGRQIQTYQIEAGVVFTGPFKSRPFDTVDFDVSNQHYSSLGFANIIAARAAEGVVGNLPSRDETLIELNYGVQLTPAIHLTPNLQYIFNPDNLREPTLTRPIKDAFVIGGKLTVDVFTLLGLAKGPGSR